MMTSLLRRTALLLLAGTAGCGDDPAPPPAEPPAVIAEEPEAQPEAQPVITSFTAEGSTVTLGKPARLVAVFTGGTGAIDQGVGAATPGTPVETGALGRSTTFTLTVTSPRGVTTQKTVDVAAVAPPSITSFTSASPRIGRWTPASLTATFADGVGVIDGAVGAVTSGQAVTTPGLRDRTTFTLTVTNAAGDAVTAAVAVDTHRELYNLGGFVSNGDAAYFSVDVFDDPRTAPSIEPGSLATPTRQIGGPLFGFGQIVQGAVFTTLDVAIANEELFVAETTGRIRVYDDSANGDVPPKRVLEGPATELLGITSLAVYNGEIYVANAAAGVITVYPAGASGNVAPTRRMTGGDPGLSSTGKIAIADGELYIPNAAKVTVFDAATSGAAVAKRSYSVTLETPLAVYVQDDKVYASGRNLSLFDRTSTLPIGTAGLSDSRSRGRCAPWGVHIVCEGHEVGSSARSFRFHDPFIGEIDDLPWFRSLVVPYSTYNVAFVVR